MRLSRGGADAKVVQEFDTVDKAFVAGSFTLPEAKSSIDWIDIDTLYVRDRLDGTMTESGYRGRSSAGSAASHWRAPNSCSKARPRTWRSVRMSTAPGYERSGFYSALDFYNTRDWLLRDGKPVAIDKPATPS